MPRALEHAHVDAEFSQQRPGRDHIHTRNAAQPLHRTHVHALGNLFFDTLDPDPVSPRFALVSIYKMDRQQHYANLDSVLSGTIKPHLIRNAWDETVRVIASIEERCFTVAGAAPAWFVRPPE